MPSVDQPKYRDPRGLKPGQRHSGQFQKGADPRRPNGAKYADGMTLIEMARTKTQDAFNVITGVLDDPDAPNKERMIAANIIFDRAHGKALQGVLVQQDSRTPSTMTTAQLAQQAQILLAQLNDVDQAIDGEYTEVEPDTTGEGE